VRLSTTLSYYIGRHFLLSFAILFGLFLLLIVVFDSVELLRRPPAGVEVLEVCPPERLLTSRTRPTDESLAADYASGRRAARQALPAIERLVTGQRCG